LSGCADFIDVFRPAFLALVGALLLIQPLRGAAPAQFSIVGRWMGTADALILVHCEFRPNGQFEWTQFHANENEPGAILGRYVLRETRPSREIEMFDLSVPELKGVRMVWSVEMAPATTFKLVNKGPTVARFGTNAIYFGREAPSTPQLPAPLLVPHYTNSLGSNQLTWTRRRFEGVHLLFEHASTNAPDEWQFAACRKSLLADVIPADVPRKFFGRGDREGFWEFSERWGDNSLLLRHGEVWLARLSNNPAVIRALHLGAEPNGMPRFSVKTLHVASALGPQDEPKPLARLSLDGDEYFNVTVETVTPQTVTIAHSRGVAALNPKRLTAEMKIALGIDTSKTSEPSEVTPKASGNSLRLGELFSQKRLDEAVMAPNALEGFKEYFRGAGISLKHVLVSVFLYYVANCICLFFICRKAEHRSWFFIWFPYVKWFPLFRAAGMTRFWLAVLIASVWLNILYRVSLLLNPSLKTSVFFLESFLFLDLGMAILHLVGCIIWCFRICAVLGKPSWLGCLLIFPLTQLLTLAYLAFGGRRDVIPAAPNTGMRYA
jgi:hypothetical protein